MMIFDQKQQIVTRRNDVYVAKQLAGFWAKRAFFGTEFYLRLGSA